MDQEKRPPRILEISWGRMDIEGLGAGKDFKLYPGGGRAWDWAETGTRHSPVSSPLTSRNFRPAGRPPWSCLGHGAATAGGPATQDYLDQRSIKVHVAETREAVKIYNELAENVPVGGLSIPPAELCPLAAESWPLWPSYLRGSEAAGL
jgi:hypothetical protein